MADVLGIVNLPREELIKTLILLTDEHAMMARSLTEISNYLEIHDAEIGANEAGLDVESFIEMAYENMMWTAQSTLMQLKKA